MATGLIVVLWMLAAAAFTSSHSFVGGAPKTATLRGYSVASGAKAGHELDFQPFSAEKGESVSQASWKPVVAFCAALALAVSAASTPVLAQSVPSKEDRLTAAAKKDEALRSQLGDAVEGDATGGSGGEYGKTKKKKIVKLKQKEAPAPAAEAAKAPAAAAPAAAPAAVATPEAAKPVSKYYDPDEDLTWIFDANPVAFWASLFFFPGIYLVFWVLGSLNII